MEYSFRDIEKKWQQHWKESNAYKVSNDSNKPKFYVLDMFPYPSGTGLHVGHPLGYIASDIYSRYKRLKGFNVLHPMGFDSFGLPAEQYALETGQHPAETTKKNIATFKSQLDKIGFCYDWSRELQTSDPKYYKWTQWIFLKLFNSYFCNTEKKALPISKLIEKYSTKGAMPKTGEPIPGTHFTADEWNNYTKNQQEEILMKRRLAFSSYGEVNWCEALGTVLANDEVVNGVSERGGHPVEKRKMRQWYLRITSYADRLLEGLEKVDFSDSMKEMQRNWIGKSQGAEIEFRLTPNPSSRISGTSSVGEGGSELPALSGHFFQTSERTKWKALKDLSRENRKNKTEAEDVLWQELRNNKLGYKVRRQHVIDGFIIDFAFTQCKLLIEADGGHHNDDEQKQYDEERTSYLNFKGYKVLRFTNESILKNTEEVVNEIKKELDNRSSEGSISPLSVRRGAGGEAKLKVYTTRPDTIFGVDFMVLAPEHDLVEQITTPDQKEEIGNYLQYVKSRSDRERQAEVKQITGCFTGAYAINPFDGREIPIWIAEYVLAGYGTGAIMAVPCGDQRDFAFAKHFNIPITNIIGEHYNGEEANATKDAVLQNSGFLNGMQMKDAINVAIDKIEELGFGKRKVNYKMRDAGFSRQRYWGEPFPIIWSDGIAIPLDAEELPLDLPHVDKYGPGPSGEGPLANLVDWVNVSNGKRETSTMPGYAGSSWYFLRYMDPHNDKTFCDRKISDYWNMVDLYIGGTEHAVGHLLYSRMWTKVLFDLGLIGHEEPYKRLVNQGMIQGSSRFMFRISALKFKGVELELTLGIRNRGPFFISYNKYQKIKDLYFDSVEASEINKLVSTYVDTDNPEINFNLVERVKVTPIHVDVNIVDGVELDIEAFKKWKPEFANAEFILEDGKYICGSEVEKMSKSKFNTVNPDILVEKYGADTFRMYEMFLGPVEMSKPWDTKGIEGVHRFLRKLWRLFFDELKGKVWTEEKATDAELKVLHKTIKKIEEDTERFSFNTAVSSFMICVNDLTDLKCHKKEVLSSLLILLTPYAPHIAEELWSSLGNSGSILDATYPKFEEKYIKETSKAYPVAINGKTRTELTLALDITQQQVEEIVLKDSTVLKWLEGKQPKKIIYVKNKMINVVV
jgi:leucyl-tRNA synthetase